MTSTVFGSKKPNRQYLAVGRRGLPGEIADLRSDIDQVFESIEAKESTASLSQIEDAHLPDGTLVAVSSLASVFQLDKTSSATLEATVVLVTGSGTGRWVRVTSPSVRWRTQATWYIDPVSGDDEYNGLTTGTAIKTQAEWTRRVGDQPLVPMTITFLGDSAEDMEWRLQNTETNLVTVVGQLPTPLHTGTVTGAATWSSGSARDGKLTDTTVASWGTLVGKLIVMGAGTTPGYRAWVWKDLEPTLGTKTGRYTRLTNAAGSVLAGLAVGDAYSIYQPIVLSGRHDFEGGFISMEYLELGTEAGTAHQHTVHSGAPTFISCKLHGLDFRGASRGYMNTCWFGKGLDGGIFDNAVIRTNGMHFPDGLTIRGTGILSAFSTTNAAKTVLQDKAHVDIVGGGTCAWFECVNGLELGSLTSMDVQAARIWGVDVTGIGITVGPCARIVLGNGFPISIAAATVTTQALVGATPKLYSELPFIDTATDSVVVSV